MSLKYDINPLIDKRREGEMKVKIHYNDEKTEEKGGILFISFDIDFKKTLLIVDGENARNIGNDSIKYIEVI